jgi:hypothetical protein
VPHQLVHDRDALLDPAGPSLSEREKDERHVSTDEVTTKHLREKGKKKKKRYRRRSPPGTPRPRRTSAVEIKPNGAAAAGRRRLCCVGVPLLVLFILRVFVVTAGFLVFIVNLPTLKCRLA